MAEGSADAKPKRRIRRISDDSRKRSARSCDFCRKRRCKCIPLPSGHGCVMCQGHHMECSYDLPRKTRFYGSIDDLSDRYRCLDAIVRATFPNDATSTVPDLLRLGERLGYSMPELCERSPRVVEESLRNHSAVVEDKAPAKSTAGPLSSLLNFDGESETRLCHEPEQATKDEPLGLIRDTSGREHFIGHSGSLQFLGQLRRLLECRSGCALGLHAPARLTATFREEDAAQALEIDEGRNEGSSGTRVPGGQQFDKNSPLSIHSDPSRDFISIPVDEINEIIGHLPPLQTLDRLVQVYFKTAHQEFPLFHRGTFEEEYETFVSRRYYRHQQQQPWTSIEPAVPEPGWLGCLHMIVAFASLSCPLEVSRDLDLAFICRHCVGLTRLLLPQLVSRCTLSNVRALILLSIYLHNHNERNAAWNLLGTATRLSFALGLHRASENGSHFRPVEREVRKRVFCTLYGFEQFLASSLGRPSGFYEFEGVKIAPPHGGVLDNGDENEVFTKISLRLQSVLAKARISLAVRTLAVSTDNGCNEGLALHEQSSRDMLQALKAWKRDIASQNPLWDLPSIREADDSLFYGVEENVEESEEPHASLQQLKAMLERQSRLQLRADLVLHLQYRYIAVLVTRSALLRHVASTQTNMRDPDVACGRNKANDRSKSRSEGERLSEICATHAVQLCRLIKLMDFFSLINGVSALDVFYAYCGVMVLILRSVLSSNQSSQQDQRELQVQSHLRQTIAETREILMRVDKCSTMKRFAHVVVAFEDVARQDTVKGIEGSVTNVPETEAGISRAGAQLFRDNFINAHAAAAGGIRVNRPPNFGGTTTGVSLDPTSSSALQHESTTLQHEYNTGSVQRPGHSISSLPSNVLSLEGNLGANDWAIDPFLGQVAIDVSEFAEWGDLESLLPRNLG
ncbi:MAG: hypothetical protein FE78DRAFT_76247 [Acidomyces sp. 'richmondensis']|nr:MAG: hypothetical protein FE78DRAFT_76247 [Acidomyces sp. 'richmondensis']